MLTQYRNYDILFFKERYKLMQWQQLVCKGFEKTFPDTNCKAV